MYRMQSALACAQISRVAVTATRDDAIANERNASYPVRGWVGCKGEDQKMAECE